MAAGDRKNDMTAVTCTIAGVNYRVSDFGYDKVVESVDQPAFGDDEDADTKCKIRVAKTVTLELVGDPTGLEEWGTYAVVFSYAEGDSKTLNLKIESIGEKVNRTGGATFTISGYVVAGTPPGD